MFYVSFYAFHTFFIPHITNYCSLECLTQLMHIEGILHYILLLQVAVKEIHET